MNENWAPSHCYYPLLVPETQSRSSSSTAKCRTEIYSVERLCSPNAFICCPGCLQIQLMASWTSNLELHLLSSDRWTCLPSTWLCNDSKVAFLRLSPPKLTSATKDLHTNSNSDSPNFAHRDLRLSISKRNYLPSRYIKQNQRQFHHNAQLVLRSYKFQLVLQNNDYTAISAPTTNKVFSGLCDLRSKRATDSVLPKTSISILL